MCCRYEPNHHRMEIRFGWGSIKKVLYPLFVACLLVVEECRNVLKVCDLAYNDWKWVSIISQSRLHRRRRRRRLRRRVKVISLCWAAMRRRKLPALRWWGCWMKLSSSELGMEMRARALTLSAGGAGVKTFDLSGSTICCWVVIWSNGDYMQWLWAIMFLWGW